MTTLNQQIREHVDALAQPIELSEIETRSSTDDSAGPRRWLMPAAAAVLATVGLAAMMFAVPDRESPAPDLTPPLSQASPAAPNRSAYTSHTKAALAAAETRDPGLVNPAVTAAIVIFSDQTTVDLRAQVRADNGYCQWFGVNARLQDSAISWHADHAIGCDDE